MYMDPRTLAAHWCDLFAKCATELNNHKKISDNNVTRYTMHGCVQHHTHTHYYTI